jgi:F0F1-type ATP synthase assembly protein I
MMERVRMATMMSRSIKMGEIKKIVMMARVMPMILMAMMAMMAMLPMILTRRISGSIRCSSSNNNK